MRNYISQKTNLKGGDTIVKFQNLFITIFSVLFIILLTPKLAFANEVIQDVSNKHTGSSEELHQPNLEQNKLNDTDDSLDTSSQDTVTDSSKLEESDDYDEPNEPNESDEFDESNEINEVDESDEADEINETIEFEDETNSHHDSELETNENTSNIENPDIINQEETDNDCSATNESAVDKECANLAEAEDKGINQNKSLSKKSEDKSPISKLNNDKIFKLNDENEEIKEIKQKLNRIGFSGIKVTDRYGERTEKRVKEFQKYYGLPVTGIIDSHTLQLIDQIFKSPLQKGQRNKDTVKLKKDLAFLGMPVPGNGTTLYGTQTEKRVKEFQKKNSLTINGIADFITLERIKELLSAPLSNGMRREDVKTLKKDLERLGFKVPGKGTNLYGKQTTNKVTEFQKYYRIKQTGTVTKETLKKMKEILSSPLQNGKRHKDTVQLKKDLAFLSMSVPGNGTTLFGTQTEKRVKEFQKKNGLAVSGIADEITLAKIKEIKNAPLSNGMRREDVKTLKKNLAKLGFKVPGKGTSLYGGQTAKKVTEFQKYYGLKQSGTVTKVTQNKIDEILNSPLQNGKKHKDTVQLKKNLKKLGFTVPGKGTNLYGKQTTKKVKEFQSYYGLVSNGIADEITLKKINSILNSPLQNGKRHKDTIQLKKNLKQLGFTVPGNGTSLYGKQTTKKVKELQSYYRLVSNGIADEITLKKIKSVLNSPLQSGKRHKDTSKLKKDLAKIGYAVPGNGTNLYGKNTTKKVKEFQKANNLPVSGIAEENTLKKIAELVKKANKAKTVKIFIDPGHGGYDSGAIGNGLYEKNIVLDIAKRMQKHLNKYAGVEIKLSRTSDKFIKLEDRAKMANDWGADYFVSVHNNSFNGSANGFESYIHNGNRGTKDAKEKQNIIHNHIASNIDARDRGQKDANFSVLRNTNMSAILIEYLFIDNSSERKKLNSASHRDKLAKLTAEGIAKAFKLKRK